MRGSTAKQIQTLWCMSGVDCIGHSKHEAKDFARMMGARTPHEIAQEIGIFSYSVKDVYLPQWRAVLDHARENSGVRDVCRLQPEHVESYLRDVAEKDPKWSTFTANVAAVEKLATALNMWSEKFGKSQEYAWGQVGDRLRDEYRDVLDRTTAGRIYENPRALIEQLANPTHRLVAELQLASKARITEATLVKGGQLRGVAVDKLTGAEVGMIYIKGKGGADSTVPVALEVYRQVEAHIAEHGRLHLEDHQAYRDALKEAAAATGQQYGGSHGLRHNGACERLEALRDAGCGYTEALQAVSREMLHERVAITLHYTRSIAPW